MCDLWTRTHKNSVSLDLSIFFQCSKWQLFGVKEISWLWGWRNRMWRGSVVCCEEIRHIRSRTRPSWLIPLFQQLSSLLSSFLSSLLVSSNSASRLPTIDLSVASLRFTHDLFELKSSRLPQCCRRLVWNRFVRSLYLLHWLSLRVCVWSELLFQTHIRCRSRKINQICLCFASQLYKSNALV